MLPESVEKMRAGIPLTDDDRWPWLDRLGGAIGSKVANGKIAVAACSALKKAYRDRLRKAIPAPVGFVLMDASREELLHRLTARAHHYMPASLLTSQLDTLERPQPERRGGNPEKRQRRDAGQPELEPAIVIDATRPVASLCEQTIAWLLERFG